MISEPDLPVSNYMDIVAEAAYSLALDAGVRQVQVTWNVLGAIYNKIPNGKSGTAQALKVAAKGSTQKGFATVGAMAAHPLLSALGGVGAGMLGAVGLGIAGAVAGLLIGNKVPNQTWWGLYAYMFRGGVIGALVGAIGGAALAPVLLAHAAVHAATAVGAGSAMMIGSVIGHDAAAQNTAGPAKSMTLGIFSGTWRKVSGNGFDQLNITNTKDAVQVNDGEYTLMSFSGINGPTVIDAPWRGNSDAPGGLVTGQETVRFDNGQLESEKIRTETPRLAWPTRLVTRYSLVLRDGRLIQESEATLYRRTFFYFWPFNVKTSINTTNIDHPEQPRQTAVYERS